MTAKEMHEKEAQHSSDQREENNVLLRSMAGMMKIMGTAVVGLLIAGIGVGAADHFKLIALGEMVAKLTASTERAMTESYARDVAQATWRATIETAMTGQKAEILVLSNRLQILESEVRQQGKKSQ